MAEHDYRYQRATLQGATDLKTAVRNRYFYGKLLDVFHLELEQEYFNFKRRLLNRLVTGPGVVCGLNVTYDKTGIVVWPGLAIDRCGREIIVSKQSAPVPLPPMPEYQAMPQYQAEPAGEYRQQRQRRQQGSEYYCETDYAHVVLCYHECPSDPVPAMAGDCETATVCAPGSIREQYEVQIKTGYAPERRSAFPDVIEGKQINYNAIVDYISCPCPALPPDCCIPLANIKLKDDGTGWKPEIDIHVRPIVYTNRLLFYLIQSLVKTDREGEEL